MRRSLALLSLALVLGACQQPVAESAAEAAGRTGRPQLWIFTDAGCPIARGYTPTLAGLQARFGAGVDFQLVFVDPDMTEAQLQQHLRDFDAGIPGLVDRRHQRVRRAGAQITPEAALFSAAGELVYRGRIDNWYGELSRKRPAPTRHELREALEALREGRAIPKPWPPAVGCEISPLQDWSGGAGPSGSEPSGSGSGEAASPPAQHSRARR